MHRSTNQKDYKLTEQGNGYFHLYSSTKIDKLGYTPYKLRISLDGKNYTAETIEKVKSILIPLNEKHKVFRKFKYVDPTVAKSLLEPLHQVIDILNDLSNGQVKDVSEKAKKIKDQEWKEWIELFLDVELSEQNKKIIDENIKKLTAKLKQYSRHLDECQFTLYLTHWDDSRVGQYGLQVGKMIAELNTKLKEAKLVPCSSSGGLSDIRVGFIGVTYSRDEDSNYLEAVQRSKEKIESTNLFKLIKESDKNSKQPSQKRSIFQDPLSSGYDSAEEAMKKVRGRGKER